jgi:hypothetical protein
MNHPKSIQVIKTVQLFLIILLLLGNKKSLAQNSSFYTDQSTINNIVNRSFSSIVSGQSSSTDIGNYASFDPLNGSFTFKGSFALLHNKKDSATAVSSQMKGGKISFLTIKIDGDLISGSYAKLFENSVLNTNAAVQAEYSFWLGKRPVVYSASDDVAMTLKRRMIDSLRRAKNLMIERKRSEYRDLKTIDSVKLLLITNRSSRLHSTIRDIETSRNNQLSKSPIPYDSLKYFNDSLGSLYKLKSALFTDSINLRLLRDSADYRYILDSAGDFRNYDREVVFNEYKKNIEQLDNMAKVKGLSFKWFTFIGGIGNKRYYTFDGTLPLSQQIIKNDLATFKAGFSFNNYFRDDLQKKIRYWNIGVVRGRDNNTSLLSTVEVNQTRIYKNAAGDTVRQVLKKYNSYTDPINENQYWEFFANLYLLSGKSSSGFHPFTSFTINDNKQKVLNAGLGYVISFRNLKKDAPVINAEGYINFLDLLKEFDKGASFWNRNEIGVRFTLPLNIFNQ